MEYIVKNTKGQKVGVEDVAPVDYTYENGEYVFKGSLRAQQSHILVCET